MRTLRRTVVFAAAAAFAARSASAIAQNSGSTPQLLDIFASRTGEDVVVHVVASGDISGYKTTRKLRESSYTLTLDLPALAPVESRYDVQTPFTRRFELWPMKLGATLGSRLVLELENGATAVIGTEGPSRLFIKISRESGRRLATTVPEAAPPPTKTKEDEPAKPNGNEAPRAPVDAGAAPSGTTEPSAAGTEESSFYNLFPTPGRAPAPLPPVGAEDDSKEAEGLESGLRLGRWTFYPVVDFSWIRGSNLLLAAQAPLVDNALLVRGRALFQLTDSDHALRLSYEARYRDFRNFLLVTKLSHFADVKGGFALTPRLYFDIDEHLVRGSFESEEIDPGRELALNLDPFVRSATQAALTMELSERLGVKVGGNYNRVQFTDQAQSFFSYQTVETTASFLYHSSPLTNLFGEYVRTYTPDPAARPGAGFTGDSVYGGVNGEITSRLVGRVQAGYSRQTFSPVGGASYRGLVAQAQLTRQLSENAVLTIVGGRQNYLSAYANNSYYTSNNVQLDLVAPLPRGLRLVAGGLIFGNVYPQVTGSVQRQDFALAGRAGVVYSFTPITFLRVEYRHEQRRSNLDDYDYRNNTLLVLVGAGFLVK